LRLATLFLLPAALCAQPHPVCPYFDTTHPRGAPTPNRTLARGTHQALRTAFYTGVRRDSGQSYAPDTIDAYIFADLNTNGIQPAPRTTDWEFIRRVSLDLTGQIPSPDRALSFVADSSADKRAKLVDELLASQAWIDKWTMFLGDLLRNSVYKPSSNVMRDASTRNQFYLWIRDGLAHDKAYTHMAREILSAPTGNNTDNPTLNWWIGGYVPNAPAQDNVDQMTANVFDTFLGVAHVNCLLCHDGRGHLTGLSLWGQSTTRYQAWQLASYVSRSSAVQIKSGFWLMQENAAGYSTDYALNTLTGNRPPRQPGPDCDPKQPCATVAPVYIFNGDTPKPGEDYRAALARHVTGDFQFARASVNYIWAELFGRGIVDPPNLFDPARLDPDNTPPDPWTLQPSNAWLLNSLAQHFVKGSYNFKTLMREIANSDTYQLASRYDGTWSVEWESSFARKLPRRLWSEELHDAILKSSGSAPLYVAAGLDGDHTWAVQFPEPAMYPAAMPLNDTPARNFLDTFTRGNRDDQPRKSDGSIIQALALMNSPFMEQHLQIDGTAPNQLIAANWQKSDKDLINALFLATLSRYPSAAEMSKAAALLAAAGPDAARLAAVQDLAWSLYNKMDFIFNY